MPSLILFFFCLFCISICYGSLSERSNVSFITLKSGKCFIMFSFAFSNSKSILFALQEKIPNLTSGSRSSPRTGHNVLPHHCSASFISKKKDYSCGGGGGRGFLLLLCSWEFATGFVPSARAPLSSSVPQPSRPLSFRCRPRPDASSSVPQFDDVVE